MFLAALNQAKYKQDNGVRFSLFYYMDSVKCFVLPSDSGHN